VSRQSKYSPEYCNTVCLLAQGGKFPEQWCATIGVTLMTLHNWVKAYPEFREAVVIGRHLIAAYWTQRAVEAIDQPKTRQALLIEILRKRLPELWGDKAREDVWGMLAVGQDMEISAQGNSLRNLTDEELKERLEMLRRREAIMERQFR
jgi:hypothetical protein